MDKKISVFLDTNVVQSIWGKNNSTVFLYHMEAGFRSQTQKLNDQIKEHEKVFGNLADFGAIEIRYDKEHYREYIDSLFEDFFDTPKNYAKQIPFPRQESTMEILVDKAISGVRPFFSGSIGGKSHSDAGFKDAVIAETIFEYGKDKDKLCIYITKDHDFGIEFERKIQKDSRFVLFPSIGEAIEELSEYFEIDPQSRLAKEFTENAYWHEYLLNEIGIKLDESVTERKVEDVTIEEENVFLIKIYFVVNEVKYLFSVRFDSIGNDMIDFTYQMEND